MKDKVQALTAVCRTESEDPRPIGPRFSGHTSRGVGLAWLDRGQAGTRRADLLKLRVIGTPSREGALSCIRRPKRPRLTRHRYGRTVSCLVETEVRRSSFKLKGNLRLTLEETDPYRLSLVGQKRSTSNGGQILQTGIGVVAVEYLLIRRPSARPPLSNRITRMLGRSDSYSGGIARRVRDSGIYGTSPARSELSRTLRATRRNHRPTSPNYAEYRIQDPAVVSIVILLAPLAWRSLS